MRSTSGAEKKQFVNMARPLALAIALAAALGACTTQTVKHGHLFTPNDIAQVQPGMSTEQVTGLLGTPDTTSTDGGQSFYYISSTAQGATFLQPTEVDRSVLAVYFNELGSVDQVANYSMQDGKVIDTIARKTPAAKRDRTFIESIFKGVGKKKSPFGDS